MANDLTVRFGGDLSGLNASLAQAKANLAGFAPQSTGQAKASLDALNATLQQARQFHAQHSAEIRDAAITTASLTYVVKEVGGAYLSYAKAVLGAEYAMADYIVQQERAALLWYAQQSIKGFDFTTQALGIQAASAAFANYVNPAAYAERSARLYAQANDGIVASAKRAVIAIEDFVTRQELAFSSLARTEITAIAAAGGMDQFIDSVNRTSGVGAMKDTLVGFTAELMKIPGTTEEAAASIEVMLATIPNYSVQVNDVLVNLIQQQSRTGEEAVAMGKKIHDAFSDQQGGGKILGDLINVEKNMEDIQVAAERLSRSLQPAQASQFYDTIITKLRQQSAQQQTILDQNDAAAARVPLVGSALKMVFEYATGAADKQRDFAAAVTVVTANLELQKKAFDDILAAQRQQVEYERVLGDETTRVSQLAQAEADIATLKSRLPKDASVAPDVSSSTGSSVDNYVAHLNNEIGAKLNRALMTGGISGDQSLNESMHARAVGPNSSMSPSTINEQDLIVRTLIGEAGNQGDEGMQAVLNVIKNRVSSGYGGAQSFSDVITAPAQFSVWNAGSSAGAMAKSVSTTSDVYQRAEALVERMKEGDLDDNTSGATSYYNPKQASPSWGPTMSNQTTIGSHVFGNTANSPQLVTDEEGQAKINQRLQEQYDKIRQINDAKAGGTVADQASLAIATQNASAAKNEVADAQKLLDAKKQDRTNTEGGSPTAILAADKAVAEAEIALNEKTAAAAKASAELKAASYREGSQQRMQILNDELTKEQAQYVQGSAKWNDLERQKITNLRQYQDAQRTSTVDTENAKFEAAKRGFSEEQELIKARAQLTGAMRAEDYQELADVLQRQAAAERAHYTALQQLYADDPKQYAKYAMLKTQVDAQEHARMLQNNLALQQQLVQTYRSSFEQIGSTVSSTLMQIIQRQATWKDLMRNVVLNIIQQFIEARIKVVADWAAGQAAQVALTVSGESAKTGATAAGTAARTDLIGISSAVQMAQIGFGVIKSIIASAAEAGAGIFGFLAPVMGPAAAAPAAAGQASVAGLASLVKFDVGSWSLPGDMVAQVHRGEMIVPAAQTPWAQSLMSAAAGGGAGGGDVHLHGPFVQAVDTQTGAAFLMRNMDTIAKGFTQYARRNPSLKR